MSAPFYAVGRYVVQAISQAMGETSKGNPQFALRFKVLGLVDSEDPSSYVSGAQQYERTFWRAITEKTIEYFVEDLKALGFTGGSFKELDPKTPGFFDFSGRELEMWCNHENDQTGNLREKWSVARSTGPLEVKPLEPAKLRSLDNLFGKHLKGLGASAPKPQPQPAAAMATSIGITDDDVPF